MLFTEFKDGILTVSCVKAEPTLSIVDVDGSSTSFRFESGIGMMKARVLWEPESIKAIGIPYQPIEKKLRTGEHASAPNQEGYPKKRSAYADEKYYVFPVSTHEKTRAAISYFSKHHFRNDGERKKTAKKIMAAAKRFGIHVNPKSAVAEAAKGK